MRKEFPGFYTKRDEAFYERLWTKGRFVFDANMLLNFFRYSVKTREALYGLLSEKSVKDRLWIPYQVALEYQRNLQNVRWEPVGACLDLRDQLKKVRAKLRADDHRERIDKLLADVDHFVDEARERFDAGSEAQWIDAIAGLFDGKVGAKWTEQQLNAVYKEGEDRYRKKIPPGFADASSKSGDDRFGDLVVWKQVIEFAQTTPDGIIFVTDDSKTDWWEEFGGRTLGPHTALLEEMAREANGVPFYIYTGQRFLELAKKHLAPQQVTDDSLQEVRRVHAEQEELATAKRFTIDDLVAAMRFDPGTLARWNPHAAGELLEAFEIEHGEAPDEFLRILAATSSNEELRHLLSLSAHRRMAKRRQRLAEGISDEVARDDDKENDS